MSRIEEGRCDRTRRRGRGMRTHTLSCPQADLTALRCSDVERKSGPTVSVIVPCYNYGRFLEGCVTSALSQEGVLSKVLVIDDCSLDDSADTGRRLAEREDLVEFRAHDANLGLMATVNEGFEWAQGEHVVVLDADDLLLPGALRRAATVLERHPHVGLVYGRALYAHEGRPLPKPSRRWRSTAVWAGADWLRLRCRASHNCVPMPTAMMRRSVQQAVGIYDLTCNHTHDLNMWLRIAAVADIAHVRAHQAIYRVHEDSLSHRQDGPLERLRERRVCFDAFFASCAEPIAERERLQETVSRALARQALWRASRAVDRGEDERLVEELVEFAFDIHPDAGRLPEWRGLRLRRRIGPGRSLIFPPFLFTGALHRARAHAGWALMGLRGT